MEQEVVERIWNIEEKMRNDEEYRGLCAKREAMNQLFLDALENMGQEQKSAMLAYVGYLWEIHYKTIEYLMK